MGGPEGLDSAVEEFIDTLQGCLVYPSETQRNLDKDRLLSHFWAGLQLHGRVVVTL